MKANYDVVIIGAGISGLTAGNYLAKHGVRVVMYEQQSKPGGYVTSFQRGDYTFEGGLTSLSSNGIVFPILQELEVGDRIEFRSVQRQITTDSFTVRLDQGLGELESALSQSYPDEKAQIHQYFRWIEKVSEGFQKMFDSTLMLGSWGTVLRKAAQLVIHEWPFLVEAQQLRKESKQGLHGKMFKNLELIDFLNRQGYPQMSALYLAGMWYSHAHDYWYPAGGMQHWSDLLYQKFLERGGEAYLQTGVRQILLSADGIEGVILENGDLVKTAHVLACMDVRTTYLQLIGEEYLSKAFVQKLRTAKASESMITLFLGLKGKGFAEASYPIQASHCWFYLPGKDSKQEFALTVPSLEDPALAPGGEAVTISCFAEYADWVSEDYEQHTYRDRKERMVRNLVKEVKQIFPDLAERLEVLDAATPLTYERYSGNFEGATAGWSWDPQWQPHFHWWREGRIPGLWLAGQWVHAPGGVPSAMLTARHASLDLVKKLTRKP